MNYRILPWRSLKTRVTLLTLAIFLVSMWALAFSVTRMLHSDMQRMLGEQEFSTVSLMAQDVNDELERSVQALEDVAHRVSPALLGNPVALQRLLEEHVIMQSLFNGGTYVTDINGTTIASLPVSANRVGINYMDRDYIAAAIQDGKGLIGRPVIGKSLNAPIIGIAQPIRDSQGNVIGTLAGVINLVEHNFLDKITDSRYGKTGGYLLIDQQNNLIVTATDKSRIMQALPAPGLNAMHDRYMQGFNGFGVAVNSRGIEVLSAAQRVPAAGWFMAVVLPSEEAFAVVDAVHRNVLLTALLLSLLASALTWWILRRELMPLLTTADALAAQAQSGLPPQVLPLTRQVETDQLIGGFNRLLETLAQREQAMHESETRYREMFESNPQPMWVYDLETLAFLTVNDAAIAHYGYSREEFLGMTILDIRPAEELPRLWGHLELGAPGLGKVALWQHCRKDGSLIVVETHSHSLLFDGHPARAVLAHDVTATKAAEQALREAKDLTDAIVENVPLMIFLKEATQLRFMVFNRAGEELVGYDRRDMLGKNDMDLFPLDQATNFMTTDRAVLNGDAGVYDIPEEVVQTANKGQRLFHTRKVCIRGSDGHAKYLLGISEDITDRKAAEQRIENLAFYDPLTNLPNRALLLDRLQHALVAAVRHQRQGALLLIDLDNFKTINDTLGHEQGDLLIQQAAQRLSSCVRASDTLARVGGDKFIVLLEGLGQDSQDLANQGKAIGDNILALLHQPYEFSGSTHHSSASIGIALFDSVHRESTEDLLKQVELAMYHAKAAGRNTLRFFNTQMQATVSTRAAMETDLRQALEQNQFLLYYQPQVNHEGLIIGAEALVRWLDPRRGVVSPGEFIPVAEATGLILPLGQWVLETACSQLARWANHPATAHLTVAVNVSARQFHEDNFVQHVLEAVRRTGAKATRLKLELTESMLVDNIEVVIKKMSALKASGVSFSLDDFGTGYSSLVYLKRLPLDQLKIDQGFVRDILVDPNDAAIAKMVIVLADSMGLRVIAEGVETEAQREFLADLGCPAYQGYLFSRPLPVQEFEALVRGHCQ